MKSLHFFVGVVLAVILLLGVDVGIASAARTRSIPLPPEDFEANSPVKTQAQLPYTVTVSISPTVTFAQAGDTIILEVFLEDIPVTETLGCFQFTLEYDDAVLDAKIGGFDNTRINTYHPTFYPDGWLERTDQRTWSQVGPEEPEPNWVQMGAFSMSGPPGLPGPYGDGVAAFYEFDVPITATGTSSITIGVGIGDGVGDPEADEYNVVYNTGQVVVVEPRTLMVNIDPPGSGSVTREPDQATYLYGEVVTLTATADPGWTFAGWSGDVVTITNPATITMDGDKVVTATFTQDEYILTVNIAGSGSVTREPDQTTYHYGEVVTLTSTADPGWTFAVWSGDLSGTDNPDTITMNGDKTVTATFAQDEYTLMVSVVGSGSVTREPDQATYHYGDVVTLTANADVGWSFAGWSGDLTGSTNPITITMDGAKTAIAIFTQDEYALIINRVGSGSVTKEPDQATYHYGDVVTLTAVADLGWTFAGWSGALSGSANPITITMDSNKIVTADFTQDEHILTVNIAGSGTVEADPAGPYHHGDVVTLTATADPHWTFAGWSGDLTGSANPETITMDGNKTVTANFASACNPLTSASISGPTTGYTDMLYTFTAVIIPSDATEPVTYTWSPEPDSGQGTASAAYRWTTPSVYTITIGAENCGGLVNDTHAIAITAAGGDIYETDDTCAQANPIPTDGTVQVHTFHTADDTDWISFDAISGTTYLIEALTPADSDADVDLEVYDACGGDAQDGQEPTFSPDVRLSFTAPQSGALYLRLDNDLDTAGPDVAYNLSVRALADTATPGVVVLVAGKLRDGDALQPNIHNVTNGVYRLFSANGYDADRIFYLATDDTLDADDDGTPDVDATASKANLEYAITQWAVDKVGPDRALTLYLMDHGGYDRFYLDGSAQKVAPDEIDGWLDTLETAAPGVKVNVIVEACFSGSFIDLVENVSQPGRVVVTSAGAWNSAYASDDGAVFSDHFLSALDRGMSLYGSFEEARWAVEAAHPDQTPWLDDDGDGLPNEATDGQEAAVRGFAYAGTFGEEEQWPPYVADVGVGEVQAGSGVITAEVRDDGSASGVSVWAKVYPPSYRPPSPGEQMAQDAVPTLTLSYAGGGIYSAEYDGFTEAGPYRVVVYAVDEDGLIGRPKAVGEQRRIYLPLVVRNYTTFPLHIGDAISQRDVAYQGEVFYTRSVWIPERLPAGGHFYFSSQRDTVAEVLVDDELAVLLDGSDVFTYTFATAGSSPRPAIVEVERATMEQLAGQTVTVEYRDVYGVVVEASEMWLIWTP